MLKGRNICVLLGQGDSADQIILKDHQENVHGETGLKRELRFSCPFPDCTVKSSFDFVKHLLQHCVTHAIMSN